MAIAAKKLLTSLAVGGAVGVASLSSMTSSPGAVKTADVLPKAPVVKAAPCPPGTVETPDACVRQVKVAAPAPQQAAPAATSTQTRTYAPAPAPATVTYQEPQEHGDGEHGDSGSEHESGG